MKLRNSHYWISLGLAVVLPFALWKLHLPFRFDWLTLTIAYWFVLAAQAIFVAAILAAIGLPAGQGIGQVVDRYRRNPMRLVLLVVFFAVIAFGASWAKAVILTVDAAALLELRERLRGKSFAAALSAIPLPALYLFLGFFVMLAYNVVIVSLRNNFAYDPAFKAIDDWLLPGHSVSDISHWTIGRLPISFFHFLEFIYFGMFPQIGAALILLAVTEGRSRSLQFAGSILLAYYISLGLFYLWPSQGPSVLCVNHFARYPNSLQAYHIQQTIIAHATALWNHQPIRQISTDYFVAFPCMHVTQPLIVIWFLRRWKRAVMILAAYDVVLIASIVLLEWHYFVDIMGGVLVAAVAILICGREPGMKESRLAAATSQTA